MTLPHSISAIVGAARCGRLPAFLLISTLLAVPLMNVRGEALDDWSVTSGTVDNASTDHPAFTSADSSIMVDAIPHPVTLKAAGDAVTFSGKVALTLAADADRGAAGGFRWGLFGSEGSGDDRGWSGYIVSNKQSGAPGVYRKRGGGDWNSTTASNSGYERVPEGEITGGLSGAKLVAGTYAFSLTLTREAKGIKVEWTLIGTEGQYDLKGSWLDESPPTYAFDRAALQMTSNFGKTAAAFSDLSLKRP